MARGGGISYVETPGGTPRTVRIQTVPFRLWLVLAAECNELVSNDDLIDKIWGQGEPESVLSGLKVAVYAVRAALRSMHCACHVRAEIGLGYELMATRQPCQAHYAACARCQEEQQHSPPPNDRLITCCGKWRYS